jgi:hypothetical protein
MVRLLQADDKQNLVGGTNQRTSTNATGATKVKTANRSRHQNAALSDKAVPRQATSATNGHLGSGTVRSCCITCSACSCPAYRADPATPSRGLHRIRSTEHLSRSHPRFFAALDRVRGQSDREYQQISSEVDIDQGMSGDSGISISRDSPRSGTPRAGDWLAFHSESPTRQVGPLAAKWHPIVPVHCWCKGSFDI